MYFQKELEKINISHANKARLASSIDEILRRLDAEDLLLAVSQCGSGKKYEKCCGM